MMNSLATVGRVIQNIIANGNSVEIIKLENDSDEPATLHEMPIDAELDNESFNRKIYEKWKECLESAFKHDIDVDVWADDIVVHSEFRGAVNPKSFNDQPDGSITIDVEDMDGAWFTVDIQNITLPE